MLVSTNILLGAVAGVTIFFGLLIARWRNASERLRGLLALASAGVLLFLIIEVGFRAMETVEAAAKGGSGRLALHNGLLFVVGLSAGLIGLAWLEQGRLKRRSAGAEALELATMIAIAASEYGTATEGGHVAVQEPGVPGKDNYIEYQDARAFLRVANELWLRGRSPESLS